jgi:hypothetical protein
VQADTASLCNMSSAVQSVVALRCPRVVVRSASSGLVVSLAKCREALLLCDSIDIGSDDEGDDIEERHPGVLGKELLRKGKGERGSDPADLHDGPETSFPGRMNLMNCLCTGDDGHRDEVHAVLDGSNLASRG